MNRGKPQKRKRRADETAEEKLERELAEKERLVSDWVPKTELGKMVKTGKIVSLEEIFEKGYVIKEPEIIDALTTLSEHIVDIAKTTRVVRAGRKFSYRATVLIGNKNGFIGVGTGKDTDRFPAVNKAKRDAKLNIKKIYRGSGSWEEQPTDDKHSVPFKVTGACGSVKVTLTPAPKGTGLAVGANIKQVMILAGIQNVWSKAKGRSSIKLNFVRAAVDALEKTAQMKSTKDIERKLSK